MEISLIRSLALHSINNCSPIRHLTYFDNLRILDPRLKSNWSGYKKIDRLRHILLHPLPAARRPVKFAKLRENQRGHQTAFFSVVNATVFFAIVTKTQSKT